MKTISLSDTIYATVQRRGMTIATLCLSGISSLEQIMKQVRQAVGRCGGLLTLMLRNGSQGWTERRSIVVA